MKTVKDRRLVAAALLLCCGFVGRAHAEDWLQFRNTGRSASTPEREWVAEWPAGGPPRAWTVEVGVGNGTAVVRGDRACIIGAFELAEVPDLDDFSPPGMPSGLKKQCKYREVLTCIRVSTGEVLWRRTIQEPVFSNYNGPHSTPAIDPQTDRVYAHGVLGDLACFEGETGEPVWHRELMEDPGIVTVKYGLSSSPLITHGKVYIHARFQREERRQSVAVLAFDKATGADAWTAEYPIGGQNSWSSAVLATIEDKPTILSHLGEAVVGLDPETGEEYWQFNYLEMFPELKKARVFSSEVWPLVVAPNTIVDRCWNDVPPRDSENRANCSHGRVVCFRIENGKPVLLWENLDIAPYWNGLTFHDGLLLLDDNKEPARKYEYARGQMTCVDAQTGEILWMTKDWPLPGVKEKNPKWKNNHTFNHVRAGDRIILSDGIEVISGRVTREGFERIAGFEFDSSHFTQMSLANSRLYIHSGKNLVCFDLSPG